MDSSLGFLFFLFSLLGCRRAGGVPWSPAPVPPGAPQPTLPPEIPGPGWPAAPISLPTSTPPWPQVVPPELPQFPGAGWEFDEPPPAAVQQRAGQLVSPLWARGSGTYRVEQTAGRWIVYQAQIVASGKKGVVAYRQQSRALPPGQTAARPPAAAPAAPAASTSSRPPGTPASTAVRPVLLPLLKRGMGLKPADPDVNVRLLQQRMGISADGRFGKDTEAAVRRFQTLHNLVVDGIVGPKTWAALLAVTT